MTTIRQQLTRKLLLSLGLLIGGGGFAVYFCARTALLAQFDAALRAKSQAITTLVEQRGGRLKMEYSVAELRGYETGGDDFLEVWQTENQPFERSRSLRDGHLPLHYGTPDAPRIWNLTLPNGQPGRAVGLKFRPRVDGERRNDARPTEAFVVVATERHDLDHTLATLRVVLAGSGLLLLGATIWIVPRVLRRELTPLQRLAGEAARIDATSLSARFPTAGLPGELAPITGRLNELLARLEDAFERERSFSSDVAHELRTPVAELRCLAELAIKLPDTRSEHTYHETLAIALHLESMLQHLLALARGERGELATQPERVALVPLVRDVCGRFEARAAARQLDLNCRADGAVMVDTDPALLRSIVTNLIENAVEYAPCGGTVDVEIREDAGRFTLRVVNAAGDLAQRDIACLFDRFWRKDAARAPDGHTGLGLSLARVFAQAIGCDLTACLTGSARLALTLTPTRSKNHQPETVQS